MKYNCCLNLQEVVDWFERLKKEGATKDEILDVLEFDSDQSPDFAVLTKAKEIVYGS